MLVTTIPRTSSSRAHMATQQLQELKPPEEFPFPFKPYDIQRDFMRELYLTLERGHVGIFESPTGTVSIGCKPGIMRDGEPIDRLFQ